VMEVDRLRLNVEDGMLESGMLMERQRKNFLGKRVSTGILIGCDNWLSGRIRGKKWMWTWWWQIGVRNWWVGKSWKMSRASGILVRLDVKSVCRHWK